MKSHPNILAILLCLCSAFGTIVNGIDNEVSNSTIKEFQVVAAEKWGIDNVELPSSCVWVEYDSDLGRRFVVCFKSGTARIQILLRETDDTESKDVMAYARKGIRILLLASGTDTYKKFNTEYNPDFKKDLPATYTVKKGDNLWGLSKRFRIRHGEIASLNRLDPDAVLKIGKVLKLPSKAPHFIDNSEHVSDGEMPVLIKQLKLKNGTLVTKTNIDLFGLAPATNNIYMPFHVESVLKMD